MVVPYSRRCLGARCPVIMPPRSRLPANAVSAWPSTWMRTLANLHRIPWERMYFPQGSQWAPLSPSANIVFSRYLQTDHPWGLPLPAGPIKVLVVISSPFPKGDMLYVDPGLERKETAALYDPFAGQIEYDVLSGQVTPQQLIDRLNQGTGFDILHYIGHCQWKDDEQTGYLILSKNYPDGSLGPAGVSAAELNEIFSACPHLPSLIYLGACESGQQSTLDAFAGLGPRLVLAGCPAVVCMQEKVESAVARLFARQFFTTLLETGCVDLAVNRARTRLLENQYLQWAVPVLYMRLVDGILFNPENRFRPTVRAPYRFLAPYRREDQDLFKGREHKAAEIYAHLCDFPVTVVYGDGGVGLTSLSEAGVRPLLEKDGWLVVSISDYADLAGEFRVQLRVDGRPVYLRVSGDAPLPDLLRAVSANRSARLALVLDQFERVIDLNASLQNGILKALQASLDVLGDQLRLAFFVHKDASNGLASFQPLFGEKAGSWIEIEPLQIEDAVSAILSPLEVLRWPVTLNPTLAREQIAPDLGKLYQATYPANGKDWVDPGQLQITCTWLYQKARALNPPLIDESLYLKTGGVYGIVVRYMEEELETHFADQSGLAKQILVAMAAPHLDHWLLPEAIEVCAPTEAGTVPSGQSAADEKIPPENITPILDRLVKAELLQRRMQGGRFLYAFANDTVADEAARLGGKEIEQAYNAGNELERVWRLWLASMTRARPGGREADLTLATRAQLGMLAEYGQHLDTFPVRILLLLRSAALRNSPAHFWLERLRMKEEEVGLIQALENSVQTSPRDSNSGSQGLAAGADLELARRLLGLSSPDLPKRPSVDSGHGDVAWAAVRSPDPVSRRTAALALTVLPSGEKGAVAHLRHALEDIHPWLRRSLRQAELLGLLGDSEREAAPGKRGSYQPVQEEIHKRSLLERFEVYLWRVERRVQRSGRKIAALSLGGGIGGGLGLGIERLVVGALAQSHVGTIFFALFSYWGLILAGLTGLGMALTGPLLLEPRTIARRGTKRLVSEILLGTASFGLANLLVAALNGLSIGKAPLVIPLGVIVGAGVSLAFATTPGDWVKRRAQRVVLGLAAAVAIFVLVQAVFLAFPAAGSGISIALSGGFFQVEYDHFAWPAWQSWMRSSPDWFSLLALVEAGLSGLALTLGALVGRRIASSWYERWREFFERTED